MASSRVVSLALLASLCGAGTAHAQYVQPTPPPPHTPLPPGLLDCTAEAGNVSAFVDSGGSISIFNVPSNTGAVRVRATCKDGGGNTHSGQSAAVTPVPGGITHFTALDFGSDVPIAARLTLSPSSVHVIGLGSSQQLVVGASFADLSTGDVTAAATGTSYRSSNPNVATVSADGLVTAVGPGTALIYALNEGAGGLATVSVLPAELQYLSVVPGSMSFALSSVFPVQPAQIRVTANLADASTVDWSSASTGVIYQSSDPSVAVVGVDGTVVGLSPGAVNISVIDGPSGISTNVYVEVTTSDPVPASACALPGFAHNADIDGVLAFVAAGLGGLRIVNTDNCNTVGVLSLPGQSVIDVRVRGTLAAVALGADGFSLVDVTNTTAPSVLSNTTSIGVVRDLWISGDVLYVASSSGLLVYDVTNAAAPVLVGSQAFAAPARAVAGDATRGLVVVLTAQPSLEVIQMIGAAPWPSAAVALPPAVNQADDVTLVGTSAYVANGRAGLHEIELINPATPTLRSTSTLDFDALGVAVQRTPQGTFVAAADDLFVNAVPLFGPRLNNTFNIDFAGFPGDIQNDANGTGIALGNGFGVVTTGSSGFQIFRSRPLVDNGGVPPIAAIVTPTHGVDVPAGYFIPVTAVATDDVKVQYVYLLVDDQFYDIDFAPPFTFFFDAGAAGSTHTLQLWAVDLGGNVGVSLPVTVNVAPPPPPPPPGPWTLSAGYGHTCHRPVSGGVLCWGYGGVGAVGDGTGAIQGTPVSALNTWDVTDVWAGGNHSCALRVNGSAACWGYNASGEMGIGTVGGAEYATAIDVLGLEDAVQLGIGNFYSCALRSAGNISCWGSNDFGRLGDGSGVNTSIPSNVVGITDATYLGAGVLHACAVRGSGTISCWGYNGSGGLGDGTTTHRATPVDVVGITDAVQVASDLSHTCALHATGAVSCWGANGNGELGDGTGAQSSTPVAVVGISDAVAVAASMSGGGGDFSCALHATGAVSCWGYNGQGQLGDGTTTDHATPVGVVGLVDAVKIATGWRHACAERATGAVVCWGWNAYGQIGDGSFADQHTPVTAIP